jgi:hypothetical protein
VPPDLMELLLGFVCTWVALAAAALGTALADKPGALATLVGTSLVIGVAISGTILVLP